MAQSMEVHSACTAQYLNMLVHGFAEVGGVPAETAAEGLDAGVHAHVLLGLQLDCTAVRAPRAFPHLHHERHLLQTNNGLMIYLSIQNPESNPINLINLLTLRVRRVLTVRDLHGFSLRCDSHCLRVNKIFQTMLSK